MPSTTMTIEEFLSPANVNRLAQACPEFEGTSLAVLEGVMGIRAAFIAAQEQLAAHQEARCQLVVRYCTEKNLLWCPSCGAFYATQVHQQSEAHRFSHVYWVNLQEGAFLEHPCWVAQVCSACCAHLIMETDSALIQCDHRTWRQAFPCVRRDDNFFRVVKDEERTRKVSLKTEDPHILEHPRTISRRVAEEVGIPPGLSLMVRVVTQQGNYPRFELVIQDDDRHDPTSIVTLPVTVRCDFKTMEGRVDGY